MSANYPAQSGGNVGNSGGSPSPLYTNISSQGQPPANPQQSPDSDNDASQDQNSGQGSPAEIVIQRFGNLATAFSTLSESYPQGSKEAEDVKASLQKWLEAVVSSTSQQGSQESNSM